MGRLVFHFMAPILFELSGVLPDSQYLLGDYSFGYPVKLLQALLTCRPPSSGSLTLTLEVGGVLTSTSFYVSASTQGEVTQALDLSVIVPANASVRWQAAFNGAPEDAASYASVTMNMVPYSGAISSPPMGVIWVNQTERLNLFMYDPGSHGFTETVLGISQGRASIVNSGPDNTLTISIQGQSVLVVENGAVCAQQFQAIGGVATSESPRLEFMIGSQRVATLTGSGVLRVANIVEAVPSAVSPGQYAFYSQGELTAVLAATGLTAVGITEPLP